MDLFTVASGVWKPCFFDFLWNEDGNLALKYIRKITMWADPDPVGGLQTPEQLQENCGSGRYFYSEDGEEILFRQTGGGLFAYYVRIPEDEWENWE